jgi:hypothetical protein
MTPAQRIALIVGAKRLAHPVFSCVRAGIRYDHLTASQSRKELLALITVLAECADPAKLKAVTEAPGDEGMPALSREDVLRRAHAEYQRLLRDGMAVPHRVRLLESEYRQGNKRRREEAATRADHASAA